MFVNKELPYKELPYPAIGFMKDLACNLQTLGPECKVTCVAPNRHVRSSRYVNVTSHAPGPFDRYKSLHSGSPQALCKFLQK